MLLSFPPATEMFQFAGFASPSYGFTRRYRSKRWVAPFGDPRITGRSPLPSAFRSVPRPSSPLGAKASTRCPSCAAPAPSPKHAASPRAEGSTQNTEGSQRAACCLLIAAFWSRCARHRPCRCSRIGRAYPCPGPTIPARGPAGPASRSRLASRCHKIRSRRPEIRRDPAQAGCPFLILQCHSDDYGCQTSKDTTAFDQTAPATVARRQV
jgi:hypothetical protein